MRFPVPLIAALAATAGTFLAVSPASAGTLQIAGYGNTDFPPSIYYTGTGGDDSVQVSRSEDRVVVDDPGGVVAVEPCVEETTTRGACPIAGPGNEDPPERIAVLLFGGNDGVEFDASVTGLGAIVEGNAGDDTIGGTESADSLNGGSGRDEITAEGGDDELAGDGWYLEESEEPNHRNLRDVLDGGAGTDGADYSHTGHGGTVIDLAGGTGEDQVTGVENATGTPNDDRITGSRVANRIDGYGGLDEIRAAGGADTVAADGRADIGCGRGADNVVTTPRDRIAPDCERATVGDLQVMTAFRLTRRTLTFVVYCESYGSDPCRGNLTLRRTGGTRASSTRFEIADEGSGKISLKLSRADRARLEKGHVFSVRDGSAYNGFRMLMQR